MKLWFIVSALVILATATGGDAKILSMCEAVRALQQQQIPRSLVSNWICLMNSESGMDTQKVTGPKIASSYSFGIFQINSGKWCSRGHTGGLCNKRCEDFANDDIQDDIVCAKMIYDREGFKAWEGWQKKCKSKPLPNIGVCKRR